MVLPGQLPLFPAVEELPAHLPTVEELRQDAQPLPVLLQGVEVPRND